MALSYLEKDWNYSLYLVSNSIRKRVGIVILFVVGFDFVRKSTTLYIEDGLERIINCSLVLSLKDIRT